MKRNKRWISLLILVFLIVPSLTGSGSAPTAFFRTPLFPVNGMFWGFGPLDDGYTPEQAVQDGCFVVFTAGEHSVLLGGEESWRRFTHAEETKQTASFRALFWEGGQVLCMDLYYDGSAYHFFRSDDGGQLGGVYRYLRKLKGTDGIPQQEVTLYVLTDSLSLTCEDVLWSFYSGNKRTATDIPFVWLWFDSYV